MGENGRLQPSLSFIFPLIYSGKGLETTFYHHSLAAPDLFIYFLTHMLSLNSYAAFLKT